MSSEMKWTQGPWSSVGHGIYADNVIIESEMLDGPAMVATLIDSDVDFPTPHNGRLIAASPSMADALMQWRNAEMAGDAEELANARKARDKALAQAMGEQQ